VDIPHRCLVGEGSFLRPEPGSSAYPSDHHLIYCPIGHKNHLDIKYIKHSLKMIGILGISNKIQIAETMKWMIKKE